MKSIVESRGDRSRPKSLVSKPLFCPSAFTLTFVVEVLGLDIWHDCHEGWLALGPPAQGVKLSYQLYPGQSFDVDVAIWPHVAKVSCGTNSDWVRTWQFLERRWLSFSIRHMFAVEVMELHSFVATVSQKSGLEALSANSKPKNITEVYLPPLRFGDRRQFAKVVETEDILTKYFEDIIWFLVVEYIPSSPFDGQFNTPYPVQDVRHQDAVLYKVQDVILNHQEIKEEKGKIKKVSRLNVKTKGSMREIRRQSINEEVKYAIELSGDWILAGIGRVIPFVTTGVRPTGLGEVIALISSANLPAQDDFSVFFVNVGNLTDVPIKQLQQNRFTHIYTKWRISEDEQSSKQQPIQINHSKTAVNFNDHHSVPLPSAAASDVMVTFQDVPFQLELRGIRIPPTVTKKSLFFGYDITDYGKGVPPLVPNQDVDILIAVTRIDARALTKMNGSVKGEFPLYPPQTSVVSLEREEICTNDVNAIRAKVKPDIIISPGVILEAQMTIEVSLGIVGFKTESETERYSRLYCLSSDHVAVMALLREITEINQSVMETEHRTSLLTGFVLDTGDTVMLYLEGPKEGHILRVWERTEDFYPTVKPVFSTSAKYGCRMYPELLQAAMPFNIMKMFVPLSVLLGLTPIYVRPALPLPARSVSNFSAALPFSLPEAVLKLGRLVASKIKSASCCGAMPTATELKSFRLELCVAPRPPPVFGSEIPKKLSVLSWDQLKSANTKINWGPKEHE